MTLRYLHAGWVVLSAVSVMGTPSCKLPKPPVNKKVIHDIQCHKIVESLDELSSELTSGVATTLVGDAVLPSNIGEYEVAIDGSYANYTYPERILPSFFVEAEAESDVQAAVIFAKKCGYAVSARSGGHSYLAVSGCEESLESPCLLIDVGRMNDKSAESSTGQLILGPGTLLDELAELLDENSLDGNTLFVPVGGCAKVGLGGHVQTGGYGVWSRQLGPLASKVVGFRIVLSNGALVDVLAPSCSTSRLNDDLYYAVLGGASGSWGIITEITMDSDVGLKSVFWRANILWDKEGIVKLFRKLGEQTNNFSDDSRWSFQFSAFGLAPSGQPNFLRMDGTWIAPEEEFSEYDYRFFQDILDACQGCIFFESSNTTERPSLSLKDRHLAASDGYEFPEPFRHYSKIWQQTSQYPNADELEALVRKIDSVMPDPTSPYLFFAQPSYGGYGNTITALPWPDSVFGVNFDIFVPDLLLVPSIMNVALDFAAFLIELFGEDQRMYWGAYEEGDDPINIEEEKDKYFDTPEKYDRLREIKRCVDEDNLFRNLMSIPPADKKLREGKGKNSKGYSGSKSSKGCSKSKSPGKGGSKSKSPGKGGGKAKSPGKGGSKAKSPGKGGGKS